MEPDDITRSAVRQAKRYHFASLQDRHPIVAMRHNAYAVALIDAVRDIATEDDVRRVSGESLSSLRKEILDFQDKIEGVGFRIAKELEKKGIRVF